MKEKGYLFAAVSALSYGLIPLFVIPVKNAGFSLDKTLFYRFFISALFILGFLFFKKENLKLSKSELLIMLILGLLYALSSEFLFLGYDLLTPGIASTILFVYPVIVALIMTFVFHEKITKLTIAALFLTLVGIFVLSAKESLFDINFIGLSVALLSAVSYGLYIVIVNKAKISFSGIKVTFYSLLFSSIYYLVKMLVFGETLAVPASFLLHSTLFALVTTVVSVMTLVYAIQLIGSTSTSIIGALEPVVAVAVSVLLFHENFTASLFLGVMLILIGVILNILTERKNSKKILE